MKDKFDLDLGFSVLFVLLFAIAAIGSACSKDTTAKASGNPHAELIPGPAGVNCYVVYDGDNKAVGGNCK